jgi:hypothetical protein
MLRSNSKGAVERPIRRALTCIPQISQHLCHVGLTSTWSTAHVQTQSHDGIRSHTMTCIKMTTVLMLGDKFTPLSHIVSRIRTMKHDPDPAAPHARHHDYHDYTTIGSCRCPLTRRRVGDAKPPGAPGTSRRFRFSACQRHQFQSFITDFVFRAPPLQP